MKTIPHILILLLLFSCAQKSEKSNNGTKPKKRPIEIAKHATYEQLIGIWEATEERKNPLEKGEKTMFIRNVYYGFDENDVFMTTSLGYEFIKENLGSIGAPVKIENGYIRSKEPDKIFDVQWGKKGIPIYLINDNELVLKNTTLIDRGGSYFYFKRKD